MVWCGRNGQAAACRYVALRALLRLSILSRFHSACASFCFLMPSTAGSPGPVQHSISPRGNITLLDSDLCCHFSLTQVFHKFALFVCSLKPDARTVFLPDHICKAMIHRRRRLGERLKERCLAEEHLSQSYLARSQLRFCCLLSARAQLAATAAPVIPRKRRPAQLHANSTSAACLPEISRVQKYVSVPDKHASHLEHHLSLEDPCWLLAANGALSASCSAALQPSAPALRSCVSRGPEA